MALLGAGLGLAGCGEPSVRPKAVQAAEAEVAEPAAAAPESECPASAPAPESLPGVRPEHDTLEYWLERTAAVMELDAEVLSPGAIADHNRTIGGESAGVRYDLLGPVQAPVILEAVDRRLSYLSGKLAAGAYFRGDGTAPSDEEAAALAPVRALPRLQPELRVALEPIPVRCGPRLDGLFTASLDAAFDRNLCSVIRAQEPVQVLMQWSDELLLARSGYVLGWISSSSGLSPVLSSREEREAFVLGPWMVASREGEARTQEGEVRRIPFASRVPLLAGRGGKGGLGALLVATERGVVQASPVDAQAWAPTGRSLTRRQFLTDAFRYRGQLYGWGGYHEGRDCSRFLMDLFAGFGVDLPRHSSDQAVAGEVIEVGAGLSEAERLKVIDRAHRRGLVLLHFPNHIMLYLGRDEGGVPMALHSFAEYLVPCEGRTAEMPAGERETLVHVDRIQVSNLELGRGSSRTSFIERITKITVVGRRPVELETSG